ncbi:hypothetical protein D3C72_742060 [compost metagenome]
MRNQRLRQDGGERLDLHPVGQRMKPGLWLDRLAEEPTHCVQDQDGEGGALGLVHRSASWLEPIFHDQRTATTS